MALNLKPTFKLSAAKPIHPSISSFQNNINYGQKTFFSSCPRLYNFYPIKVKWGPGFNKYYFHVHWQYIKIFWKPKTNQFDF